MNIVQAEENLKKITTKFSKESFIFDLLGAYDFPKSTISKLKIKLKKNPEDDVIVPSKLHFVGVSKKELDAKFDELLKDYVKVNKQPRFIIVTDYQTIKAYDTKMGEKLDTDIKTLSRHPDFFLPWAGIEKKVFQGENPADVKAAVKLAKFFDLIIQDNLKLVEKNRHALNVFLTRILFCFFAEDTDIFEKGLFTKSINDHTNKDGNDLADYLKRLFEVLNKKSRAGLPEFLREFPYVNGGLFADEFPIPKFSKWSRESLIDLGSDLNWAEINPDIFGSMIQAVVHPDQRAGLGMHYTSVTNIMKVIEPLFLNDLYEEFKKANKDEKNLKKLLKRLSEIKIFDPACGSGNFLIIAYKELRKLEMLIYKELPNELKFSYIPLRNFYGIEIDDFAHEVAILSLWLTEHQMDVLFYKEFGAVKASLPLKDGGNIFCANALRTSWEKLCPNDGGEIYLIGNPPYLGQRNQQKNHAEDLDIVFKGLNNYKNLDYIASWFYLASRFIKKGQKFSFVTTNSLNQGSQVSMLWPHVFKNGQEIFFCYESFKWTNNASGNAGVTVVIVGIQYKTNKAKYIFSKETRHEVSKINAYLVDGPETIVSSKNNPISKLSLMIGGNQPREGGYLCLTDDEKKKLVNDYPEASKFIKKLIGTEEFLKSIPRWCLWIEDHELEEALNVEPIKIRIEKVRLKRKTGNTVEINFENVPHRFVQINRPIESQIIVPNVSSERRDYIPSGFLDRSVIVANSANTIFDADPYEFGVLNSKMHMIWVKAVAGRLENRIRYSTALCWNTFPCPDLNDEQKEIIRNKALKIISTREKYTGKNLVELYDPDKMPNELKESHLELDNEFEKMFSIKRFKDDYERLSLMLSMYEKMSKK